MTATATRSKWGFCPCDYQTFKDLKEYHRWLYRAYCQHRRLVAWSNKTVKRAGPEPPYVVALSARNPYTDRLEFARFGDPYRGPNLYLHVLQQYRLARRPVDREEDVPVLDLPQGWTAQLAKLRQHFA